MGGSKGAAIPLRLSVVVGRIAAHTARPSHARHAPQSIPLPVFRHHLLEALTVDLCETYYFAPKICSSRPLWL